MEINYLGHSTVELVDGDTRVLIDPFLKPNNPAALVTAEEVNPTHVFMTHAHMDHIAGFERLLVESYLGEVRCGQVRKMRSPTDRPPI